VKFWPTPHGMSGAGAGLAYDGHGSELSQAVRVADGFSDSARSAAKIRGVTIATPTSSMKFRSAAFADGRTPNPTEIAMGIGAPVPQEPWERGIPRTVGKGFPNRVPRLQALGNAVVPEVVAMFGRWIAMVEDAGE
jgi:hypothetical protein